MSHLQIPNIMQFNALTDKAVTFFLLLCLCFPSPVQAQETPSRSLSCQQNFTPAPDGFDFLTANTLRYSVPENTRINRIHITRLPIFDLSSPDEDLWIYALANRLHIQTEASTIEQILLVESGDEYDPRSLQESARLLRLQNFFQDASIQPVSLCNDLVDIEIVTRDTWSLTPGISFDRSGGENSYAINLREANFLGKGKLLTLVREENIDRDTNEFLYDDNNLFGSRHTVRLGLSNSSDGFSHFADLGLPFYALDSRQSWQLSVVNERLIDNLFFRGEEVSEVQNRLKALLLQAGISRGLQQGYSRRYFAGYQYQDNTFSATDGLPPPAEFPQDRKLSFPFLAYESLEDNYATGFNLNQIYRTEDLHLGRYLSHKVGFAAKALGSDQNRLVIEGHYRDTLIYSASVLWSHELNWQGLWNVDSGAGQDIELSYQSRFFKHWSERHTSYIRLEGTYIRNMNSNQQVTLGGLNGARAYDNRFQTGDRRVVLNLEDRIYSNIHLLNLIRVGGAVFMDVGSAWTPGQENGTANRLLANAGFGLRFTASKGASRQVAHLDFAFPLTNASDPAVDSFQIAFNVKSDF